LAQPASTLRARMPMAVGQKLCPAVGVVRAGTMATKQKKSGKPMPKQREKERKRAGRSGNGGGAANNGTEAAVVAKFSDRDRSVLGELVARLAAEIRAQLGSPSFAASVRALVADARAVGEGEGETVNGHVPLYRAEEKLVFAALEELARERAHEEAVTIAAVLERGDRVYASACDSLERIVLVYGSLKTYNNLPWDRRSIEASWR
jgi:hypothetical protein